jgi:hypothetical protein
MLVHCEHFSNQLLKIFKFYNPSFKLTNSADGYLFINHSYELWNSPVEEVTRTLERILLENNQEMHLCLFLPEIVTSKLS